MEPTYPFDPHDWTTISPLFVALSEVPIQPQEFSTWLEQWNELDIAVCDAWVWLKREAYQDSNNLAAEQAYRVFTREIFSTYVELTHSLMERALVFQPEAPSASYEFLWQRWRNQIALFRPQSLPIQAKVSELESSYRELMRRIEQLPGDATAHWMNRRSALNDLMMELLKLRRQLAHNSQLPTFLAYRWRELNRLGYRESDHQDFHGAVERLVVPIVSRFRAEGILRPSEPEIADVSALSEGVGQVLRKIHPSFGAIYQRMQAGYLDLGSRPRKAITSEQWFFPREGMPYLHTTSSSVGTMLHESGHAVHDFLSFQRYGSLWNFGGIEEFQEFAAISMDLLGWPYYEKANGGLYTFAESIVAQQSILHLYLDVLVNCVMEDAFEHWVYGQAPEDVKPKDLDEKWLEMTQRFMPWELEGKTLDEVATGWQRWNWSLFRMPLYSIAYATGTIGACQLGQLAKLDRPKTVEQYKVALTLGHTQPLPALFRTTGLAFPFTERTVEEALRFILNQLT